MEDILEEPDMWNTVNRTNSCKIENFICSKNFENLDEDETAAIDRISLKIGLSVQDVSSILLTLELKGIIEQMPGKIYRLKI